METLNIDFSKNGEGKILMTAVGNTLYLDESKNETLKIGDKVTKNSKEFNPLVKMNFYKVESVDILMEKLITIKNNIILFNAS